MKAGNKETIKFSVTFKKDITASDLENENTSLNLTLQQTYVQADGTENNVNHPIICKRATTLHTTTCQRNDGRGCNSQSAGYKEGDIITYGINEGIELVTGYALDCDVDKNNIFAEDERFYYISDFYDTNTGTWDDNYATLIFYSNVENGVVSKNSTFAYDVNNTNYNGPVSLIGQMPTKNQWINVLRRGSTYRRQILNSDGGNYVQYNNETILLPVFDYSDYGARLLTRQEISKGCGSVSNLQIRCEFLLEDTSYEQALISNDYWLDTPLSSRFYRTFNVYGAEKYTAHTNSNDASNLSARPTIEIPKVNIDIK